MGALFDFRLKLSIFCPIALAFKSPFARDRGVDSFGDFDLIFGANLQILLLAVAKIKLI
jgi:hypothetical protein